MAAFIFIFIFELFFPLFDFAICSTTGHLIGLDLLHERASLVDCGYRFPDGIPTGCPRRCSSRLGRIPFLPPILCLDRVGGFDRTVKVITWSR